MKTNTRPAPRPHDPDYERWLDGFCTIAEAAEMRGCSKDTVIRQDRRELALTGRSKLIRLSERRLGMRRRDALLIE